MAGITTHLASKVGGTTLGDLENDWGLLVAGGLEGSNNCRRRSAVLEIARSMVRRIVLLDLDTSNSSIMTGPTYNGWNSEFVLASVFEKLYCDTLSASIPLCCFSDPFSFASRRRFHGSE